MCHSVSYLCGKSGSSKPLILELSLCSPSLPSPLAWLSQPWLLTQGCRLSGASPRRWDDAGATERGGDTRCQGLQEMLIVSQLCHSRG